MKHSVFHVLLRVLILTFENCTSVTLPKRRGLSTFIAQFENKNKRIIFVLTGGFVARINHFRGLVVKLQMQLQCSSLIYVHTFWISPNNPTRMIWTQSLYKKIWLTARLPENRQILLRFRTKKWPKTHTYAYIFELPHNFWRGSCRVSGRHSADWYVICASKNVCAFHWMVR